MYKQDNFDIGNLIERLIRETENRNIVWDVDIKPNSMSALYIKHITEFKKLKIDISYYRESYNSYSYLDISFISRNFILYSEIFGVTDSETVKSSLKRLVATILRLEEEDRMG